MKQLLILLCFSASLVAAEPCQTLADAKWLLGHWVSKQGEQQAEETWQQISADTFEGSGQVFKEQQLTSFESLRLVAMSDSVFYLAKVTHNPLPIAFKLTECAASRLVFENAQHDFPKRIEYHLESESTLQVVVSDGAAKGFTLRFTRMTSSH
ncbi:MAG: hypothetical protein HWE13_04615 [Gammaproteobacteria bacterium]|nr:hypothetical protein [Gammaproteobacteria bacterium]NVK87381.1 hypothetical protein [Gammaproteobacteria bacterium]